MDPIILFVIVAVVLYFLYTQKCVNIGAARENFNVTEPTRLNSAQLNLTNVGSSDWAKSVPNVDELKATIDAVPESVEGVYTPSVAAPVQEDWVNKFKRAENLTIQENFINAGGSQEAFYGNELPCAKRFMSLDLRKSPVVTVIPSMTPWNQTVIHPSCIAQDQTRPSLDD